MARAEERRLPPLDVLLADFGGFSRHLPLWHAAGELGPIISDRNFDQMRGSGERLGGHHPLPDSGHILAVVVAHQREHPCHQLREPVQGDSAGHDADGVPLVNRVGHAYIKHRMREEEAALGGEVSGHHYFRDFSQVDSGVAPFLLVGPLALRFGDGRDDPAVYRPSDGTWIILRTANMGVDTLRGFSGGGPDVVPVPLDFNGDGFPDLAITTVSGVTVLLNAADWGGGGAAAAPPRRPGLHRPVFSQPQMDSFAAVLATSENQADHPLALSFTDLQAHALRQSPLETERGQAAGGQATIASRQTPMVRHAQDAVFERWNDGVLDVLAWNG